MHKRLIPAILLAAYGALLVKVMVFKDIPTIRVGQLMLNFGGMDAGHAPNLVPFATIVPYLLGRNGLIIAGINIVGNIILLVPLGFLAVLVYRRMSWRLALLLAVASGLAIETLQTVLHVGIFDIDDVILNALGFMIGWGACIILTRWLRAGSYKNIGAAVLIVAAAAGGALYAVYPWGQPVVGPGMGAGRDLCGGTGGNGQIISTEADAFVLRRNDGIDQKVTLTGQAQIHTPAGPGSSSDLAIGQRVTLVGGPNPDGSFTAQAVFVCSASGSNNQPGQ